LAIRSFQSAVQRRSGTELTANLTNIIAGD